MPKTYIPMTGVAKRYGKTPRTIARWVKAPPKGFPTPIEVNGRLLWDEDKLETFEQAAAASLPLTPEAA